ncbi:MAG: Gfo/Idh/MocA family oxidoreductase [Asticcacaulis sp.]
MFSRPVRLGVIGLGKIAVDQHLPAVAASRDIKLIAGCSLHAPAMAFPVYDDLDEMLCRHPEINAVSICTPPLARAALAMRAIAAGPSRLPRKTAGRHARRGRGAEGHGGEGESHPVRQLAFALRRRCRTRQGLAGRANDHLGRHPLEGKYSPVASRPGLDYAGRRYGRLRSRHQCPVDLDLFVAAARGGPGSRPACAAELRGADPG